MINLERLFGSPFDDRDISIQELFAFGTDHFQRLSLHNPGGIYNGRITATNAALTTMSNCVSNDTLKLGLRKARKAAKDAFRDSVPALAKRVEATLIMVYPGNSLPVMEVFPHGREIFHTCTDDTLDGHLVTMNNALAAHATVIENVIGTAAKDALITECSAARSAWTGHHSQSEQSGSNKALSEEEKNAARKVLQWELYLNLLEIVKNNPRNPSVLRTFMRVVLLLDHTADPEAEEPPVTPPTPPTP